VSAQEADLLENAGVDTVRELAGRNPANLHAKLAEGAGAAPPAPTEVDAWVAAAKSLPTVITY
jgi:hypothetical protein